MKLPFYKLPVWTQLVLSLAVALPLLWGAIAYDLHRLSRLTTQSSYINIHNLTRAFAEEVKSSVNSVDYALIDLRDEWQRDSGGFAEKVLRQQRFLEQDVGFQVAVLDKNGKLLFSSNDPKAKGGDFSDREHFQVHRDRQDDKLFISKPLLGRVSQRWTIQFTRPLRDAQNRFNGVIVLSVAPEYFSRFYQSINLGKDSSISVVRQDGEFLVRTPPVANTSGNSLFEVPAEQRQRAEHGEYEAISRLDGIARLYGWRLLPKGNLIVRIGQARDTLFAAYYQQRRIHLLIGTALSAVLACALYYLLLNLKRRRENDDALQASHARLASEQQRMQVILQNSHDAFVAVTPEGVVTDWNRKAESLFGWTANEAIGKPLDELIVPPEFRKTHLTGFHRFAHSGSATIINEVVKAEASHRNGSRVPVELAVAGYQHGNRYAVTAFIRDMTARHEADRREAERQNALDEARAALHHAQKLEAVGKLTGGVAHDFNNVLQVINGNLQLLQLTLRDNEAAVRRVESSLKAVDRGARLSSHLLAFARRQPLKPTVLDVRQLLESMLQLLEPALGGSILVEVTYAEKLWPVRVDPSQLENVILNIAINARDAMQGKGTLSIDLHNFSADKHGSTSVAELYSGEYVKLVITDTGSGMSPEVLQHAIDPFFTTKAPGEGSGLGLSMAYGFAKQSGGHLHIVSQAGLGTSVELYLPKSHESVPTTSEQSAAEAKAGSGRILAVEDDLEVQSIVVAMLKDLGYEVLTANSGDEAMQMLLTDIEVDLLFTDVLMPGLLKGPDLAREALKHRPNLTVLFTSGYTQNTIGEGGLLDTNTHLLTKPYRREELADTIKTLLASKSQTV
jgi:PAS domain S-box-containing protein